MARVTVEDCIDKVESPYELVLVAKERATQLNSGIEPTLDRDNDKNTVISLREIAEENIKVSDLSESAIYKLRKHVEQVDDGTEDDEEVGDDFVNFNFIENENEINLFFDKKTYNLIGWQTVDIYKNVSITYLSSIKRNQKLKKEIFKLPQQN